MEEQRQKSDSLRQELRKSDKAKKEVCFFSIFSPVVGSLWTEDEMRAY